MQLTFAPSNNRLQNLDNENYTIEFFQKQYAFRANDNDAIFVWLVF
jgi:hypothetical protein